MCAERHSYKSSLRLACSRIAVAVLQKGPPDTRFRPKCLIGKKRG